MFMKVNDLQNVPVCGSKSSKSHVALRRGSGGYRWRMPIIIRRQSGNSVDVAPLLPEFVQAPGGEGAAVADGPVENHLLELGDRGGAQHQIMLFRVRVGAGSR